VPRILNFVVDGGEWLNSHNGVLARGKEPVGHGDGVEDFEEKTLGSCDRAS